MFVLTGASGGIGHMLIPSLLETDDLLGVYHSKRPDFNSCEGLYLEQLDIRNPEKIRGFVERLQPQLKKISLLHFAVENIDGLALTFKEEDWDRVFSVNLKGNFSLTRCLLPIMIQNKWGRIIHISSIVGFHGTPGTIAYASSKTGLLGMSRVLAKEYGRYGITSNVLNLGYFDVGLIHQLSEEKRKGLLKQIPSKSFGSVSNIVSAIHFLMEADYVNGAVIDIDGGL